MNTPITPIRLSSSTRDRIIADATKSGTTNSTVIRAALEHWFESLAPRKRAQILRSS